MDALRKDSKGRALYQGEYERNDGKYKFAYTENRKRRCLYASTLEDLREKAFSFLLNSLITEENKMDEQYYDIERRTAIKEEARMFRRKILTYDQAEVIYSISHRKLRDLAEAAGRRH